MRAAVPTALTRMSTPSHVVSNRRANPATESSSVTSTVSAGASRSHARTRSTARFGVPRVLISHRDAGSVLGQPRGDRAPDPSGSDHKRLLARQVQEIHRDRPTVVSGGLPRRTLSRYPVRIALFVGQGRGRDATRLGSDA